LTLTINIVKLEIDEKKDVMEEWYDKLIEIRRKEDG